MEFKTPETSLWSYRKLIISCLKLLLDVSTFQLFSCWQSKLRDGLDPILIFDSDLTQNADEDDCVLKIECETGFCLVLGSCQVETYYTHKY